MTPAGCEGCPYRARGLGFVPGKGPLDAKVAAIGQGPGRDELILGEPFVGAAGLRLDLWLAKASIPRTRLYIDNGVRCRIQVKGKDVAPRRAIEQCYHRYWGPVVHRMAEQHGEGFFLLAVGVDVSKFLCGEWCGESAAGSLTLVELPPLKPIHELV